MADPSARKNIGFAGRRALVDLLPSDLSEREDEKPVRFSCIILDHDGEGDLITIKLNNGYNMRFRKSRVRIIEERDRIKIHEEQPRNIRDASGPHICILGTGGTILSKIDYRTGGVHPSQQFPKTLKNDFEKKGGTRIRFRSIMNKLSEDMIPDDWKKIALETVKGFEEKASGVVVLHGTDTIHYSSAALSFFLQDLPGPVILTGSMRSTDRPSSDSFQNLTDSLTAASSGLFPGVYVLSRQNLDDGESVIYPGTRVRKIHTTRRDAVRSIDGSPVMVLNDGKIISHPHENTERPMSKPKIRGEIDPTVPMLWLSPATKESDLKDLFEANKASVIVGTGLGHIRSDLIPTVKKYVEKERIIVLASSCIFGRVELEVYSTGRNLRDAGIIDSGPMTPETAHVKLMWSMGTFLKTGEDPLTLFRTNISGEWDPIRPYISPNPKITDHRGGGPD